MKRIDLIIKKIREYLDDEELDIQERSFVILSCIALVALVIALLSGISMGQELVTTLFTASGIIVFSGVVYWSIVKHMIKKAMVVISVFLVFVFEPITFMTSSGINGGTPVWFFFSIVYILMVLSGKTRVFFIVSQGIVTLISYGIGYFFPEVLLEYSRTEAFIDSVASLVIITVVILLLVDYQTAVHKKELKKSIEINEEIEEIGRSQSRFFSSMSHELRTPINTILGLNEVILTKEDVPDEIKTDAESIQKAGGVLLSLVNDILDMSKIESGKMEIVSVEYLMSDMISQVVNMVWVLAANKGLEFNVDIDPDIPAMLYGDEVRIKQIIVNLLTNSIKYTSHGYVSLHMECEKRGDEKVLLTISVQDTGIGIKKEDMPYIFDAFKRVHEDGNYNIQGTGLGLSIVKQLVDLMGGEIKVSSVYTAGTTFTVSFMQQIKSIKTIGNISISHKGLSGKKESFLSNFSAPDARILLVDDNEMNIEVETKLLKPTGIKVHTSLNGYMALERAAIYNYDLIFLDHLMPGMDGIEVLKELRARPGAKNYKTPAIALTANAGTENKKLYQDSGFEGVLTKPVSAASLFDILKKMLPPEKVHMDSDENVLNDEMSTARGYKKKLPVVITTSSVCDLPDRVIKKLGIPVIPFVVKTDDGYFRDNVDMVADELVNYLEDGKKFVISDAPDVASYERFFAENINQSHHIIHIAFTSRMSDEYSRATAAAAAFDNVTVFDSHLLSSAQGLLVLRAAAMANAGVSVEKIIKDLEMTRSRVHCSFVLANTEFMKRKGFISDRMDSLMKLFSIRPAIGLKDGAMGVDNIFIGKRINCYDSYIRHALAHKRKIKRDILVITYVGIGEERLERIAEEVKKKVDFKKVIFKQASAAIASNCGPGAFGLLFMDMTEHDYKLSEMI